MINDLLNNINKTILEAKDKQLISTKEISDGYHTFGDLYTHRIVLFSVICNSYPKLSWKSRKHFDEDTDPMFNGCFIAGITTPLGDAIYHIKLEYWDDFKVTELDRAPRYDEHKSDVDLIRLKSLINKSK